MSHPRTDAPGHIPVLDGVRGMAILLVLLYHFSFSAPVSLHWADQAYASVVRWGWAGVDLFFVLSGFLITGILADARGGAGYFRNFYTRRVLRIFPLYYAFWILLFLAAPLMLPGGAATREALWDGRGWYWGYAVNVLLAQGGWASGPTEMHHLWSLAVEEQFYLLWPPLVLLLARRRLMTLCGAGIAAALGLRAVALAAGADPVAVYVLPFMRMDALLAGSLLALAVREHGVERVARLARPVLLAAGGGFLVVWLTAAPGMSYADPRVQTAGFTCLALGFAALLALLLAAPAQARAVRFFGARELRVLGRYSYAVYMVHPVVNLAMRGAGVSAAQVPFAPFRGPYVASHLAYTLLAGAVSVGVALASWHMLEKHFLRLKDRLAPSTPRPAAEPSAIPLATA